MKKTIINNRLINQDDFFDKKFKPSLQTKLHFIKIFQIFYPEFKNNLFIKSLEWDRDCFNLKISDNKTGEIINLILRDNLGYKKCSGKLCTNNICTGIHNNIKNKNFLKFLVYFGVKGNSITLKNFLQILTNDYKAKKEFYQIFWKQNRPPFSIIQDWGHPLHKFRFIVHEGVFRNMDQSIKLNLPEASIHHSERECQGITPGNKATGYHFFNFPGEYYDHRFDKYYYLSDLEKEKYLEGNNSGTGLSISTDLNENDIVMGEGTDKLSRALEFAADNIKKNNIKILSFNCCCVPRVIGDDIYSVLKRTKDKIDIPFLFQGQLEKTPYEQKVMLLEEYINALEIDKIKKIRNSISLFGYHENIYQKELCDVLVENGIKINTSFIPTIDVRLLENMFKSELFIFSPNNFQKEAFEYPFQDLGINFINPVFPYGFINTERWLNSISKELNIELKFLNNYNILKEEYFNRVKYVKSKEYKIAIVLLGLQEVKKFLSTDYMNNIDIIGFLTEMGFKIDLLIFDNFKDYITSNDDSYKISDGKHELIEEYIFDIIENKKNIKVKYFGGENEFDDFFIKNNYNLIYSDIYFDDRITKIGINQFNLKNFHVGHSGALDTINGLINLCEMSFYKDYYTYFKY